MRPGWDRPQERCPPERRGDASPSPLPLPVALSHPSPLLLLSDLLLSVEKAPGRRSGVSGPRAGGTGWRSGRAGEAGDAQRPGRRDTHRVGGDDGRPGERDVLAPVRPVGARHDEPVDGGSHQRPRHLHGHPWDGAAPGDGRWRARGPRPPARAHAPHSRYAVAESRSLGQGVSSMVSAA